MAMGSIPGDSLLSTQFENFEIIEAGSKHATRKGFLKLKIAGKELNTVYFQDRPLRGYGHFNFDAITGKRAWLDLFGNDNPNSILSGNGRSFVFETGHFKVRRDGSYISRIKPLSSRDAVTGTWENASLLIDPTMDVGTATKALAPAVLTVGGLLLYRRLLMRRTAAALQQQAEAAQAAEEEQQIAIARYNAWMQKIDTNSFGNDINPYMINGGPGTTDEPFDIDMLPQYNKILQRRLNAELADDKVMIGDDIWDPVNEAISGDLGPKFGNIVEVYKEEFQVRSAFSAEDSNSLPGIINANARDAGLDNLVEEFDSMKDSINGRNFSEAWSDVFELEDFQPGAYNDNQYYQLGRWFEANGRFDTLEPAPTTPGILGDLGGDSFVEEFAEVAMETSVLLG